jgi:hypothetical protein
VNIVDSPCAQIQEKPKLVFFRSAPGNRAHYIRLHLQEHVKCLSQFFNVVVIAEDECDYKKECDTHKPALALFESGVYVTRDKRRIIRNTDAYPEIPKLGLCNADAYCESRKLFLSDMYRWNVDTFFTISVSMAEYTPAIADRLFVWPNFADGDVYRDYGEAKLIPVLFTGSFATHYPWRNRIYRRVSPHYPSFRCPHFGWGSQQVTARMIFGEEHARLLNASAVVPACGTIANEVVRKHFEIPGARACLVAQRTPALDVAGFIDMENCVFAEEQDVIDKLDYLFSHPEELERITEAGHRLVHSAHTLKHRDQLYQWFDLNRTLKSDQKIVQTGPFQPLRVVYKDSAISNVHAAANGVDRLILRQGDARLWAGSYVEAEALFLKCLNYHNMPEPKLRLVLTNLLAGDAAVARRWSVPQIKSTLATHGAETPDPIEWAYLIVTALCQGSESEARKYSGEFSSLRHPELDRARWITNIATGQPAEPLNLDVAGRPHYTVHSLPERDLNAWTADVCRMLKACGQSHFVDRILGATRGLAGRNSSNVLGKRTSGQKSHPSTSVSPADIRLFDLPYHRLIERWTKRQVNRLSGPVLQGIEGRLGYFLPYDLSKARSDEFFRAIETMSRENNIVTAIIVGACAGNYVTEACLHGARRNPNRPTVFCVGNPTTAFARLQKRYSHDHYVRCVKNTADAVRIANTFDGLNMVIFDGSEGASVCDYEQKDGAEIVILGDTTKSSTYDIYLALITRCEYSLLGHNPEHYGGYAIFEKVEAAAADRHQLFDGM